MMPSLLFGFGDDHCEHAAPTPPRPGPARLAVLEYHGRRVLIARVLECCEHAHQHGLVGATVTCLGPREEGEVVRPCAVIQAFDWASLMASNDMVPTGGPPGISLDEAQAMVG